VVSLADGPVQNQLVLRCLLKKIYTVCIYKDVLGFEVSMQDSFGMNISNPIQNFLEDDFYSFLIDFIFLTVDKLLEIVVVVVKDDFEQLLLGLIEYF
jgi:hypothetical protein